MVDALVEMIPIKNGKFVVQNITPDRKKTIHLFGYPILYLNTRDLLAIPGVDESIIKVSLLKGVLKHRILARDILVIMSDVNLVQYNADQAEFLKQAGITIGVDSAGNANTYKFKSNVPLIGDYDGTGRHYHVQNNEKFINNSGLNFENKIQIYHNGRLLIENEDYTLSESGGTGTGFDTIYIFSFAPGPGSSLVASYFIPYR